MRQEINRRRFGASKIIGANREKLAVLSEISKIAIFEA